MSTQVSAIATYDVHMNVFAISPIKFRLAMGVKGHSLLRLQKASILGFS
jgi:hypothetical protein